jgi:inhibitor of cysteine peptidase
LKAAMLASAVALIAGLALASSAAARGPRVIAIGQKDNDETAAAHVGDTVVLSLPASPSTGYKWRISALNRGILRPDATGYIPALHPPLAQQSSGIAIFVFKAIAKGTTTLKLTYVNTSQSNPVTNGFTVLLTVEPPRP